MKDKLIKEIQASLALILTPKQQEELRKTLTYHLNSVDVSVHEPSDAVSGIENADLLDAFMAAKKVEGCSEKSLQYYHTTINRMLDCVR